MTSSEPLSKVARTGTREDHIASDYPDALEAVLEALDIPYAATVGDDEIRAKIMEQRVMHAVIFLRGILDPDRGSYRRAEDDAAYLRARLAEHPPVGYRTWEQRMAELREAGL